MGDVVVVVGIGGGCGVDGVEDVEVFVGCELWVEGEVEEVFFGV